MWLSSATEHLKTLPQVERNFLQTNCPAELQHVLVLRPRLLPFSHRSTGSIRHPNTSQHKGVINAPTKADQRWGHVTAAYEACVLEALAEQRGTVLSSPELGDALRRVWVRLVPGDEKCETVLSRQTYNYFEVRIREVLCEPGDALFSINSITDDFMFDSKSTGTVTFLAFQSSLLEVADNWTASVDVSEYISFVREVIMRSFSCSECFPPPKSPICAPSKKSIPVKSRKSRKQLIAEALARQGEGDDTGSSESGRDSRDDLDRVGGRTHPMWCPCPITLMTLTVRRGELDVTKDVAMQYEKERRREQEMTPRGHGNQHLPHIKLSPPHS